MNKDNQSNSFFINIAIHVIIWLLVIQLIFDVSGLYHSFQELVFEGHRRFDDAFLGIPLLIALFYWNSEWLIPKFLHRNSWWKYLIAVILSFFIFQGIGYGLAQLIEQTGLYFEDGSHGFFDFFSLFSLTTLAISTSLAISKIAFVNAEQKREALEKQKATELKYLTAQVNPHFLHNTLNTIFSLANDEKAPMTQEAILKLSEMMRYMVKESKQEKVPLQQEITFIQSFIDLQKLRLADAIPVEFNITGVIGDLQIAPLLLITVIENTFKHGIQYQPPQPIIIDLKVEQNELTLTTQNILKKKNQTIHSGTGLANLRKRLTILYPNEHDLKIEKGRELFIVSLNVTL